MPCTPLSQLVSGLPGAEDAFDSIKSLIQDADQAVKDALQPVSDLVGSALDNVNDVLDTASCIGYSFAGALPSDIANPFIRKMRESQDFLNDRVAYLEQAKSVLEAPVSSLLTLISEEASLDSLSLDDFLNLSDEDREAFVGYLSEMQDLTDSISSNISDARGVFEQVQAGFNAAQSLLNCFPTEYDPATDPLNPIVLQLDSIGAEIGNIAAYVNGIGNKLDSISDLADGGCIDLTS